MRGAPGPGGIAALTGSEPGGACLSMTIASSELNGQALAHKVGSIFKHRLRLATGTTTRGGGYGRLVLMPGEGSRRTKSCSPARLVSQTVPCGGTRVRAGRLTGHNVTGVHGILVLDEAEAIHELDLDNLAGAMGRKVGLNIGLGSYRRGVRRQSLIAHTRRRVRDPFRATSKGEEAHQSAAGCPGRGACWTPRSWWAAGQVLLLLVVVLLWSVESSGPTRYKMCEKGGRTDGIGGLGFQGEGQLRNASHARGLERAVVRSPLSAGAGWELELGRLLGIGMDFWRRAVWGSTRVQKARAKKKLERQSVCCCCWGLGSWPLGAS